jgi:hypothetical protein
MSVDGLEAELSSVPDRNVAASRQGREGDRMVFVLLCFLENQSEHGRQRMLSCEILIPGCGRWP